MEQTVWVSLRISQALRDKLVAKAASEDRSLSSLIRKILTASTRKGKNVYEL
jgi:predicted HicB family RNase H-like nuclease